ncbi:hypothetical protein F8568_030270 [Actinomadura sp. LD22]|uniref:Uncharacterized protein n=1 Tax=Actinomadura physcomitrii TaxID=2650748 RepID=A0A6I4MP64_9ACTN|nr:hypothetical protein [Actinomadura physcomitrii]MWA04589.1 hypothetical protein [Actinomadura physcomitrii]
MTDTLKDMARALAGDFDFDHVDYTWDDKRERHELTIVVAGNKYEVLLQYIVAARTDPPPVPGDELASSGSNAFAYEVFAEWNDQGRRGYKRVALCDDDTTVLALLRGLRAEYAAREGFPLNVPEQPGWATDG